MSLNDNYSTICGYTKDELKTYFNDHLNRCAEINNNEAVESLIEEIDDWYDGYSWDGQNFVYNPWSVLNLFYENIFDKYWFESGTPSFLIKIIERYGVIEEKLLKPQTVAASVFSNFKLIKESLNQIKDKEYYEKYLKRNKKIIFLAIVFNNKKVKTVIEKL
jgi:hypothetical protein